MSSVEFQTPAAKRLEQLAKEAISVTKKAKKHRQNLAGVGFYAKKLAELRILATNAFTDLRAGTAGDTSALAELINSIFSPDTRPEVRLAAERELAFSLRTTWRDEKQHAPARSRRGRPARPRADGTARGAGSEEIFPLTLLVQAERGYLTIMGRQINGCFQNTFYDACAVMMRRLLEVSIIEAFEHKGIAQKIKNAAGDYLQLSDLVTNTLAEPSFTLSRNTKRALPRLRDNGHLSAHGRSYFAQKSDLERVQPDFRVAVEELLRISRLL